MSRTLIRSIQGGGTGMAPTDVLLDVIPNVVLSGSAATITMDDYKSGTVISGYAVLKQATFNTSGQITVNLTAPGATDTVTVLLFTPASQIR